MKGLKSIDRRTFLKTSAKVVGGGLLIPLVVPTERKWLFNTATPEAFVFSPNAFLHIGEDESIKVILSKVEMGQGIWTTLAMLIADELDCDLTKISIEHSPVDAAYNHTSLPMQATVGSSSTYSEFDRFRLAGATARVMLVEAAARRLGVDVSNCRTENGYVLAQGKRISYGSVATDAAKVSVPQVELRSPKDWKYIGKSQPRLDGLAKVNGTAEFGIDIQFPGLLTAVVVHSPVFGGRVKSFASDKAMTVKGVRAVVQIPTGIAVVADHYWAAKLGRDALTIEWDLGPNDKMDTDLMLNEYRALSKTKGALAQDQGDITNALSKATSLVEYEGVVPYLAHAAMEPLNCTVSISNNKCEIWTGTQLPTIDRAAVAAILNYEPEQILIHTPFLGGSFGRRGALTSDWIIEAVHIARVSGMPIKIIWSREDDMRAGYYRPAYLHRVTVALGEDGFPIAWRHIVVGQSVFTDTFAAPIMIQEGIDESSVEGVKGSPYLSSIPDHSVELHTTPPVIPVLPWRSVGFSHTCFVMETLIDELASGARKDPIEYRRTLLKDYPRHKGVLDLVAEKSNWYAPAPKGTFRGIAVNASHGSFVAHVVELSVEKMIRIHRVVCAIDCGLAVNPDGVRAQMESAIVFGLSAALYGEITLKNGQVEQSNFHNYRVLRMNEMPTVEVHIVPSTGAMGGAGEPGVPPIAPALANALHAATGKRIRNLPVRYH